MHLVRRLGLQAVVCGPVEQRSAVFVRDVLQLHAERERERQRRSMVNQGADGGNQWRRDASGRDPLGRLPQLEP